MGRDGKGWEGSGRKGEGRGGRGHPRFFLPGLTPLLKNNVYI